MQASWGDGSICSPIPEPGVSVFTCELRVWLQGAQETRGDAGRRQVRALRPSLPSAARSLSPSSLVSGFQVLPPHGTAIGGDNGCVSRPQLQQKAAPAHSGALGEWRNSEQPSGTRVAGPGLGTMSEPTPVCARQPKPADQRHRPGDGTAGPHPG